ncbi:prolyl oligopeptidase family serine peptidase [Pyxidicoccus parkwayensis]|uniref:Prolyl oligopeptidase family serine peptidase n=1 Tax=Pyxidicoccus parkwayensis TaxID=2813578 RepID=A0ABX7NR84_9BACT|nr:prolyl oligopeptidase family serine peptidase [Pyxidicoccus parkwaysis]QSQ20065.1 prolyl oligopeptidase family serine peptidase [Pyxidicoccus parkwaysis]
MRFLLLLTLLGLALVGRPALAADGDLSVTVLGTGQAVFGDQVWPYQLLRLQEPGKAPTYAQWFPPRQPGVSPAMMLTRPYDGISWTGEAVDAKWAARGDGLHPDDSEPHYHAGSSVISYVLSNPDSIAAESFYYLFNDFGVLAVFGRFYAGGDIQNDRDDMHAGMRFLAQAPGVDRSRIGVYGGSWGGFEALYAAVDAPAESRPRVGVALFPLSDFAREVDYVFNVVPTRVTDPTKRQQYATFFEPYLRRIIATTGDGSGGTPPDFSRWTREHLASTLATPFLVVHEDWDTLVPVEQTATLSALAGPRITPLYFQHWDPVDWNSRALDHGPLVSTKYWSVVETVSVGHLLTNLGRPTQFLVVPFTEQTLATWLWDVRVLQWIGGDVRAVAPLLRELMDPRVFLFEPSTGKVVGGADWVTAVINMLWGTQYTSAALRDVLAVGLPL